PTVATLARHVDGGSEHRLVLREGGRERRHFVRRRTRQRGEAAHHLLKTDHLRRPMRIERLDRARQVDMAVGTPPPLNVPADDAHHVASCPTPQTGLPRTIPRWRNTTHTITTSMI